MDSQGTGHIRALRLQRRIAQASLAALARVPLGKLRRWERGLEPPDFGAGQRIATVLGVPFGALAQAQAQHASVVTPGEGYTTATPAPRTVTAPQVPPPQGRRLVLDLFCGAGGLSFGFEQTGAFVTAAGVDLLADRVASFVANHECAKGVAGDLRSFALSDLARLVGEVDVVVGGPPCQGFSSIRPFRTLTEGDPRNSLAEHYVLFIAHLQPEWFVFENVVGLLTHERGERLLSVVEGLKGAGYRVDWRVINAALYGVPQHRERIVIVGNRMGIQFVWPEPTHWIEHRSMAGSRREVLRARPLLSRHIKPALTLMDAIGDLPPVLSGDCVSDYGTSSPRHEYQRVLREGSGKLTLHRATRHSPKMLEIIRHAGANIAALPAGLVKSGFSSCYSRLEPCRPSTTLTVNFVHPASNRCIHPYQDRALTPREGARIQSFPDRFEFRGTTAQIVKQIGNAVPPLLGRAIAQAIMDSETHASATRRKPVGRLRQRGSHSTVATERL